MNAVRYPRVVFVCGVSGVGKTHLIRQVLPELPEAVSWTASEIIGEARQNTDPEFLRTLPVNELARSQELLVRAFRHRWDETTVALILLDGHCVLDTDEGFFAIDTGIIRRLDPMAFIYIEEHVERILERRTADARKRRPMRTTEQLRDYQDRSRRACEGFSQALDRPMFQIYSEDTAGLLTALRAVGVIAQGPDHHV
jgi:adenylate kinase